MLKTTRSSGLGRSQGRGFNPHPQGPGGIPQGRRRRSQVGLYLSHAIKNNRQKLTLISRSKRPTEVTILIILIKNDQNA